MTTTHQDCRTLDAQDPLAPLRDHFSLPAGVIYLDGNSLGVLPKATAARVADVVTREWGTDLIQSWNTASWFDLPQRLGNQLAPLIGAGKDEVVCTDSTSINLYKVLSAALNIAREDSPARRRIVSERSNFPTDLYIAEGLCKERGLELVLVEPQDIATALTSDVAVLMLTHVNYRTGAMHDMAATTAAAHAAGILCVWDLAHSAGAVPVDLHAAGADFEEWRASKSADFAVGCGYKYLNGGPGAPAFVYARRGLQERLHNPIQGWLGHAEPFVFSDGFVPAAGIKRMQVATPTTFSLVALEAGVDLLLEAGMPCVEAGSRELCARFIEALAPHLRAGRVRLLHEVGGDNLSGHLGFSVANAQALHEGLMAQGIVAEYRYPDLLRVAFNPLYTSVDDLGRSVESLNRLLARV